MNNIRKKIKPPFQDGTGLTLEERIQNLVQKYKCTLKEMKINVREIDLLATMRGITRVYEETGMAGFNENYRWADIHSHKQCDE